MGCTDQAHIILIIATIIDNHKEAAPTTYKGQKWNKYLKINIILKECSEFLTWVGDGWFYYEKHGSVKLSKNKINGDINFRQTIQKELGVAKLSKLPLLPLSLIRNSAYYLKHFYQPSHGMPVTYSGSGDLTSSEG